MQGLLDADELPALDEELQHSSQSARGRMVIDLVDNLDELDSAFDFPESEEDQQLARKAFDALAPEVREESAKLFQHLMMAGIAQFYEYLSVAVHGVKLTSLVSQAKRGDDEAFGKAVQIDGRILTVIPYFKDRYARACTEDHEDFLSMVSRKRASPPYKGKLTHKSLWLMFAYLESCGLLSTLTGEELLDLYEEVGSDKSGTRIEDVKNMQKRLAAYRSFQQQGGVSTP